MNSKNLRNLCVTTLWFITKNIKNWQNILDTSLYFCCSRWRFIYLMSSERLDQIYLVFICKFTSKAVILLCFCQLFCHYVFLSSKPLNIRWYFIFCLHFLYLSVIVLSLSTRWPRPIRFMLFSYKGGGRVAINFQILIALLSYNWIFMKIKPNFIFKENWFSFCFDLSLVIPIKNHFNTSLFQNCFLLTSTFNVPNKD